MIQKIDHIGLAVKKIAQALPFYQQQLGLKEVHIEEIADQKVRIAILPLGESTIELLEPTDPQSPVAKFIAKKGEGIHHIAFEVDELSPTLKELDRSGICLVDKEPRQGAQGKKIAFLHPKSTFGALIELTQK